MELTQQPPRETIGDDELRAITLGVLRKLSSTPAFVRHDIRDDLLQQVRQAVHDWRGEGSLRQYVAIIARHRALGLLRVRARYYANYVARENVENTVNEELGGAEYLPGESLAAFGEVEFWDAVDRALDAQQRGLLELLLSGASQDEIGHQLNLDQSNVSRRLAKLRRVLAMALLIDLG